MHSGRLPHPFVRIMWVDLPFKEVNIAQIVRVVQVELLFGEINIVQIMQVVQIVRTELPSRELYHGWVKRERL